jgi:hypothetical protein
MALILPEAGSTPKDLPSNLHSASDGSHVSPKEEPDAVCRFAKPDISEPDDVVY